MTTVTGDDAGAGPAGGPGGTGGTGPAGGAAETEQWRGVERALLRLRRLVLLATLLPLTLLAAAVPGTLAGPGWALPALVPLGCTLWGWGALARNWRSWRYAERADDLLIARGVLRRELTVVPYGRMQLVEVTSGPLERRYGLARLQLHTAAATTDATIPGLVPEEAARLRDRLTELGEARSAGL
ncbi:PH domain-containing protein [Streptomyces sp. JJ36]|uniref:PH domain-containing protein n=1 Tax=Streptomyces sp. JJ36 TaxID=2736645 RepID=UPI001F39C4FF|nr:PH domain-containing protein [Streptomyces sp. JJ36]MCF6523666.1 PH domain-containing protein [Streptomyces sp. JJ36]